MEGLELYTSRYALIKDGIVSNVIICDSQDTANVISTANKTDYAVNVKEYFVTIGDTYVDGVFYHAGDEIERQLSLEETVAAQADIIATQATTISEQAQQIDTLELVVLQLGGVI